MIDIENNDSLLILFDYPKWRELSARCCGQLFFVFFDFAKTKILKTKGVFFYLFMEAEKYAVKLEWKIWGQ